MTLRSLQKNESAGTGIRLGMLALSARPQLDGGGGDEDRTGSQELRFVPVAGCVDVGRFDEEKDDIFATTTATTTTSY